MADVTVTASLVRPLPGAVVRRFPAAATNVIPGKVVYLKSDGTVDLADADAAATALVLGIVVSAPNGKSAAVAVGDMVDVCLIGAVTGFSSMTPGTTMYDSVTAGAVADARPVATKYAYVVGRAIDASTIYVLPYTDTFAAL